MDCLSCSCLLRLHMLRKISLTLTFAVRGDWDRQVQQVQHCPLLYVQAGGFSYLFRCFRRYQFQWSTRDAQAKFWYFFNSNCFFDVTGKCTNFPSCLSKLYIFQSWTFKVWIQPPRNGATFARNIQVRQCAPRCSNLLETVSYVNYGSMKTCIMSIFFWVCWKQGPFIRFWWHCIKQMWKCSESRSCASTGQFMTCSWQIMLQTCHVSWLKKAAPGKKSTLQKAWPFESSPWLERCQSPSWQASWAQAKPPSWITSWPRRLMVYASRLLKMSLDRCEKRDRGCLMLFRVQRGLNCPVMWGL